MHIFELDRIGAGLPVAAARDNLEAAVRVGAAVVTAPPGTGKTSYVPPLIANMLATRGVPGKVLVTQPRRVAVRAAARRLASFDGTDTGATVGFTVRGERRVSESTRVEILTPGVLLRRLLTDPALDGVGAVILDEVHERSIDGDLLLGMIAEVRELRDDLVVVAMSATLDADGIAAVLGPSGSTAIVHVPSSLHPLDIAYAPSSLPRLDGRGVTRAFWDHLADLAIAEQHATAGASAALDCLNSATSDALVFVPSARDVDEVVRRIRERAPHLDALPLHGRISAREQDRAVSGRRSGDAPRIVVSTSLAESSLTVPGVRLVIDSGLSREVRRDRGRDMTGLVTVSASRASAEQRAGRAARQRPGRAVRAYSETDFARMPQASAPEFASGDLIDAALLLAAWGTPGGTGLRLLTPPPAASIELAVSALRALDLVRDDGLPTRLGTRIASLPVGVREARALLSGTELLGSSKLAAEIVAALSGDYRERSADLSRLLRELRSGRAAGADRWQREARRLAGFSGGSPGDVSSPRTGAAPGPASAAGVVVALARPEWIARRSRQGSRSYLLASGTRAALPENSPLIEDEWIAVHEVQRAAGRAADGTGAIIRLAAALDEATATEIGAALLSRTRYAAIDGGKVRVREEQTLGAIVLSSASVSPTPQDTVPAIAAHVRRVGIEALGMSDSAATLRNRLGLLRRELGDPWPDVSDTALLDTLEDWLGPELARLRPGASLHGVDVASALRGLLPWPEATRLDDLAPERLSVPSGSNVRIDYPASDDLDGRPVVAVKLQELFGLAETPRLVDGRVPVLFHLLSPARRPLAVTDDLASFWSGPYQDVRREMRGRYPKHPWPEDPWTAEATARTKRRSL